MVRFLVIIAHGLEFVMLTGDNRCTAAAVARHLGLDAVEAEIEPAGKVARVKTTIRPRLRERLAEMLVDQNALVTAGQLLARLDDGELKLQVEVAASGLAVARATLERVRVDEARAQAMEKLARLDHQRVSDLLITKVSSQGEFDKAVEQWHVAEADLKRTQAASRTNRILIQVNSS